MDVDLSCLRAVGDEVILDFWPSCAKHSKIYQLNFTHAAYFCTVSDCSLHSPSSNTAFEVIEGFGVPVLVERPLEALVAKFLEKNKTQIDGELSCTTSSYSFNGSQNRNSVQVTEDLSTVTERVLERHFADLNACPDHSPKLSDSNSHLTTSEQPSAHAPQSLRGDKSPGSPLNYSSDSVSRVPSSASSSDNSINESVPLHRLAEANPTATSPSVDGGSVESVDPFTDCLHNGFNPEDAFLPPAQLEPDPSGRPPAALCAQNRSLRLSSSPTRALPLDAAVSPPAGSRSGLAPRQLIPSASAPTWTRSISRGSPERVPFERSPIGSPTPHKSPVITVFPLTADGPVGTDDVKSSVGAVAGAGSGARTTIQLTSLPPPPNRVSRRMRITRAPQVDALDAIGDLNAETIAKKANKTLANRKNKSVALSKLKMKPFSADVLSDVREPAAVAVQSPVKLRGRPPKRNLDVAAPTENTSNLSSKPLQCSSHPNTSTSTEPVVAKAPRKNPVSSFYSDSDPSNSISIEELDALLRSTATIDNVRSDQSQMAEKATSPSTSTILTAPSHTPISKCISVSQVTAVTSDINTNNRKTTAFVPPVTIAPKDPFIPAARRARPTPAFAPPTQSLARGPQSTVSRALSSSTPFASVQSRKSSVASASSATMPVSVSPTRERVSSGTDMFVRSAGTAFNPSANTLVQRSVSAWNASRQTRPSPPSRSTAAEQFGDSVSVCSDDTDYYSCAGRPLSHDALSTLKGILLSRRGGSNAFPAKSPASVSMFTSASVSTAALSALHASRPSLPLPATAATAVNGPTHLPHLPAASTFSAAAAAASRSPNLPLLTLTQTQAQPHGLVAASPEAASARSQALSGHPVFQAHSLAEQHSSLSSVALSAFSPRVSVDPSQSQMQLLSSLSTNAPVLTVPTCSASSNGAGATVAQFADMPVPPQGFAYLLIPEGSSSSLSPPSVSSVSSVSSSLPSTPPACVPLEEDKPCSSNPAAEPVPQLAIGPQHTLSASNIGFLVAGDVAMSDASSNAASAGTSGQSPLNFSFSDIPEPSLFDIDAAFRLLEEIGHPYP